MAEWPTAAQVKRRLGITTADAGVGADIDSALAAAIEQVELDVGRPRIALVPLGDEADTNLLETVADHGYEADDVVQFSDLLGAAGLSSGTDYYVISDGLTANRLKVSATEGGAAVDITTDLEAGFVRAVIVPTPSLSEAALLLTVAQYKATDAPHGVAAIFDTGGIYVARQNPHYQRLLVGQRERFGVA